MAVYFGLSPSHLVELASTNVIEHVEEEMEDLGQVHRRGVSLPDAEVILGAADVGGYSAVHSHAGYYQILWVLKGRLMARVDGREFELRAGQAIRFGANFEHNANYLEETQYIVVLVPKRTH